ncbi:MAG: aminodeoxychorismate/anthranilate synthase component II [Nanoarchaeota archaeon]
MIDILFIDNFDSFTYNLVDEFEKKDCRVEVYRNNTSMNKIEELVSSRKPNLIVISPGPSSPGEAGNSIKIINEYSGRTPIFGVCLGHQAIVEAFGGVVDRAPEAIHGKSCPIAHDGRSIFKGLENPLRVGRYHSLIATRLPESLIETANYQSLNMAVRHREYFVEGVQFHPESILTPSGGLMIDNLLDKIIANTT